MNCPVCKSSSFEIIRNIHKTNSSTLMRFVGSDIEEFELKVCRDCGVVYSRVSVVPLFKE